VGQQHGRLPVERAGQDDLLLVATAEHGHRRGQLALGQPGVPRDRPGALRLSLRSSSPRRTSENRLLRLEMKPARPANTFTPLATPVRRAPSWSDRSACKRPRHERALARLARPPGPGIIWSDHPGSSSTGAALRRASEHESSGAFYQRKLCNSARPGGLRLDCHRGMVQSSGRCIQGLAQRRGRQ
jgi:hypothetical protein